MGNVILAAAVLFSGGIGVFLLYLAEKRVAEVMGNKRELPDTLEDGEGPIPRVTGKRGLLIGGSLLCGGAMAAFLAFFYHASLLNIVNTLLLYCVLWPCAWADLRVKLIPNSVLLYGVLLRCGVLGAEFILLPQELLLDLIRSAVAAAALCIVAVLCRLVVPKAIGFGDVKLLMLMGFFLGTDQVWNCIFFAMLGAFICSVLLLLTRRATMKTEIPYAPFLLLGTVTATFLVNV